MKITTPELTFDVRPGTADDVPLLLSFIRAMAEYEKLEVAATEELLRDSLFGDRPAAQTLLAFVGGQPVAYAVYFFTFSSFVGKRGLWLEDVFVHPDFRGRGIGKALMGHLADIAAENGCGRFEWTVLDWNQPAIDFYRAMGASLLDDWRVCRLDEEGIGRLRGGAQMGHGSTESRPPT